MHLPAEGAVHGSAAGRIVTLVGSPVRGNVMHVSRAILLVILAVMQLLGIVLLLLGIGSWLADRIRVPPQEPLPEDLSIALTALRDVGSDLQP